MFEHLAARRQQRRSRRDHLAELQQVVLIATGAMKQKQGRGSAPLARREAMDEGQVVAHHATSPIGGRTSSISFRWASRNFGSFKV